MERQWYRSVIDGQRAYLVDMDDGQQGIKYDRPDESIVRKFVAAEWIPDFEHHPLTPFQVAHIAFEADRKLCLAMGLHDKARKEWLSLKDEERTAWRDHGPAVPEIRGELYAAITDALRGYAT